MWQEQTLTHDTRVVFRIRGPTSSGAGNVPHRQSSEVSPSLKLLRELYHTRDPCWPSRTQAQGHIPWQAFAYLVRLQYGISKHKSSHFSFHWVNPPCQFQSSLLTTCWSGFSSWCWLCFLLFYMYQSRDYFINLNTHLPLDLHASVYG